MKYFLSGINTNNKNRHGFPETNTFGYFNDLEEIEIIINEIPKQLRHPSAGYYNFLVIEEIPSGFLPDLQYDVKEIQWYEWIKDKYKKEEKPTHILRNTQGTCAGFALGW